MNIFFNYSTFIPYIYDFKKSKRNFAFIREYAGKVRRNSTEGCYPKNLISLYNPTPKSPYLSKINVFYYYYIINLV